VPPASGGETRCIGAILDISLEPTVAAPGRARDALVRWLARERADGVLVEAARLAVSELVTNCVRHAHISPGTSLRLTASLRTATLRIELHDTGTDGTVARRPPGRDDDTGGFGLDLVAQLSDVWGIERDRRGTTVWLELPTGSDGST
jgi:serine/threonine-protein kinase RsbW